MSLKLGGTGIPAAAVAAAAAAAAAATALLIAATPASAAEACGSELVGAGSSLQGIAQSEVWSGGWKGGECETKPTVKYTVTSSGKGLEQWGSAAGALGGGSAEKPFPMFVATDIAPEGPEETSATQLANMAKAASITKGVIPDEALAIPVAQSAIAVLVSPPAGCALEEGSGKPSIKSKTLEEEWEKDSVTFKNLIAGAKLSCKACKKSEEEALLESKPKLEAYSSQSGTTAAFKRYLASIGPEKNEFVSLTETAEKSANTTWPKTLPSGQPVETGNTTDKILAETVRKTAGTMGFADLSDAAAVSFGEKAAEIEKNSGHDSFFVRVQNNKKEAAEPEYASPESSKASNCSSAEYKAAPGEIGPGVDWSKVVDSDFEAGKSTNYPICTLTYDIGWRWYSLPEPSAAEILTGDGLYGVPELEAKAAYTVENEAAVANYLRYVISTEAEGGGQSKALEEKHYAKLPTSIQKEVAAGLGVRSSEPAENAATWPDAAEEEEEAKQEGEPGKGPIWLASVGDSYIAGEAGRWAGNSNRNMGQGEVLTDALGGSAYFDERRVRETILGCHRSASAEIYIGRVGGLDAAPFGVNFACSGAETATQWTTGPRRFKPGLDFSSETIEGVKYLGQALLLEKFALKHNVKLVAISIGGNNIGFGNIATACVSSYLRAATPCSEELAITGGLAMNFAPTIANVREAILNVAKAMKNAGYSEKMYKIVVQNYPSPIPKLEGEFRYLQGAGGIFAPRAPVGCQFWNRDAEWTIGTALPTFINFAVRAAGELTELKNIKFLNLESAFNGHRLCENGVKLVEEIAGLAGGRWDVEQAAAAENSEWINRVRPVIGVLGVGRNYQLVESLHPNYWGQLALRNCLRLAYNENVPRGGACNQVAKGGLTEINKGEPVMKLKPAREFNVEKAGEATGKSHVFKLGSITVTCASASFKWEQTETSNIFVLTPAYSECTGSGGSFEKVPVTATVKECGYVIGEPPSEADESELLLPPGCQVKLSGTFLSECKAKIEGPQELEKTDVKDLNTTKGSFEGELSFEIPKLAFTSEGTGCAGAGIPSEGTGEYKGKVTEKGAIIE
jgi:hypothetical protein